MGVWHVFVAVWGIGDRNGRVPLVLFVAIDLLTILPAYRMLMVLVYEETKSLLAAVLMHTSLTTTTLVFTPRVIGGALLTYDVLLAVMLWAVVAGVRRAATAASRPLSRDTRGAKRETRQVVVRLRCSWWTRRSAKGRRNREVPSAPDDQHAGLRVPPRFRERSA